MEQFVKVQVLTGDPEDIVLQWDRKNYERCDDDEQYRRWYCEMKFELDLRDELWEPEWACGKEIEKAFIPVPAYKDKDQNSPQIIRHISNKIKPTLFNYRDNLTMIRSRPSAQIT